MITVNFRFCDLILLYRFVVWTGCSKILLCLHNMLSLLPCIERILPQFFSVCTKHVLSQVLCTERILPLLLVQSMCFKGVFVADAYFFVGTLYKTRVSQLLCTLSLFPWLLWTWHVYSQQLLCACCRNLLLRTYYSVVSVSVAAVNSACVVSADVYRTLVNAATVCNAGVSLLVSTKQRWAPAIFSVVRFRWSATFKNLVVR
jgi:hypothetical protein